jgi:predicted phage-related endonuclease
MSCADLAAVHVVGLIGGPSGFRVWYVARDLELEALLEKEASRFWNEHVMTKTPPPLDGTSASRDYLETLYPAPAKDVVVPAPAEMVSIGEKRCTAHNVSASAIEAKEVCNAMIIEAMGKAGATVMWCPTWRATYRPNKAGKRLLTVTALGPPKVRQPRPNAKTLGDVGEMPDDGEAF